MLHIEDGFAVIIEEEDTTPSFYDFSHLTEEAPPLQTEIKTDKNQNLLLF
jgi:hypothetical protein